MHSGTANVRAAYVNALARKRAGAARAHRRWVAFYRAALCAAASTHRYAAKTIARGDVRCGEINGGGKQHDEKA